jgi:hypothetical protein
LFDSGNGVVRGFSFQKVPHCHWHGPGSHINRVGAIKPTHEAPGEIVQIAIENGGNLRPFFAIAKKLTVANDSDNLAGFGIDNITVKHALSALIVQGGIHNAEFGALFPAPCNSCGGTIGG